MPLAKAKIALAYDNFTGHLVLCSQVIAGLTANPVSFPVPNPSIFQLTADNATLQACITAWGTVGARGSHADYVALLAAAKTVRDDLLLEMDYVNNLVNPADPYVTQSAFIALSGFSVANLPAPQGWLNAPEDFHRHMSDSVSSDDILLIWKKPLGLMSPNNVKYYRILVNGVNTATVTKCKYLFTTGVHGQNYAFRVQAVNHLGAGNPAPDVNVNF